MKIKIYSILITFLMVFLSCSKDEDFRIISPANISFVHENGAEISINECVNPEGKYAVKIETTSQGFGEYKVISVDYTVNGVLKTMTFLKEGAQINPVTLIDGLNTIQIVESGYTSNIYFVKQDDFELVE
ncbi:MAG: hypothetical protein ACI9YE_001679 [Psychroserpens sp.]|jgi:hypothetical protein